MNENPLAQGEYLAQLRDLLHEREVKLGEWLQESVAKAANFILGGSETQLRRAQPCLLHTQAELDPPKRH